MYIFNIEDSEDGLRPSGAYGISIVNHPINDKNCLMLHFGFKRLVFIRYSNGKIGKYILNKGDIYPVTTKVFIGVII